MQTQNIKSSNVSSGKPVQKAKTRSNHVNGNEPSSYQPTHEEIARLASQLYVEGGCREGQDAENWLRAEQMLRQQAASEAAQSGPNRARDKENQMRARQ